MTIITFPSLRLHLVMVNWGTESGKVRIKVARRVHTVQTLPIGSHFLCLTMAISGHLSSHKGVRPEWKDTGSLGCAVMHNGFLDTPHGANRTKGRWTGAACSHTKEMVVLSVA